MKKYFDIKVNLQIGILILNLTPHSKINLLQ